MANVHVLDHPLIQHKLAILRNKKTSVKEFRELVGEIAGLMCYEATRNLPTREVEVQTPVATAKCRMLSGKKLAIVPVLRAGLGMVDTMVELIPSAKSVTSACTATLRPTSLWNTTASCRRTSPTGWFTWSIPCWQPAAAPSRPLIF